jgi:phosphatidylglycerol:prolipoprotein diacylglycerol transferase
MTDLLLLSIDIGIDPVLFNEAGIEVTWHGLFTALGVIIGVAVATAFARRAGYEEDTIYNVALCLVIGGIIGARALYVIENWSDFDDDPVDIIRVNTGGISIYGALIGGTIGAWLYAYFRKVPNLPRGADIAAMGGILGMAVGRIGDVINGEHFASDTDLPWGVVYTHADSPSKIQEGLPVNGGDPLVQPQHPAVAYEMIGDIVIFGALLFIFLRSNRDGLTFFAWVFLYGLLRTLVSFLRLDDIVVLGLRTAQLIGIASMVIGLGGMIYLLRKPPEEGGRAERRRMLREMQGRPELEEEPAPAEEPAS